MYSWGHIWGHVASWGISKGYVGSWVVKRIVWENFHAGALSCCVLWKIALSRKNACPRLLQFLRIFAYRGYECFTKYLKKPQSSKISYKFTARVPFPLILFCPDDDNMFKSEEFAKCNLTHDDYFENGQWVGKSKDPDCTDPKALYGWFILALPQIIYKSYFNHMLNSLQLNKFKF